jgi:hypothetical protein
MAIKTRNGFQLSGHLNGNVNPPSHRYQKSTTNNQDSQIFVGDPVILTSAGTLKRIPDNKGGDTPNWEDNEQYLGVVTGIYETEDGRPLTHRTRKYAATADTFWCDVIDDPDAVWEVSMGESAVQTMIGAICYVEYASANQTAGISGAGVLVTATPGTTVATRFRVIDVVNLQRDGANASNADQDGRVRVVATEHVFRNTA